MLTLTRSRTTLLAMLALGSALALAGCAASESESPADSSPQQPAQGQPPGGGVSGLIAAASDGLLQVQSSDEQTAVSYTADTTVSSRVAGALSDIAVGDCVTAITPADAAVATSIIVTDAVDGECAGGFAGGPGGGFPGGDLPDGAPTDLPTDFPTDGTMPSGAPTDFPGGGGGQLGSFASGPVTAITGDTLTVDAAGADDTTTATEVSADDATAITVTVASDAGALVVGKCVTAQGEADDSGGFAATSLVVSEPGEQGCTAGFPGAGQFPGSDDDDSDTTESG